MTGKRGINIYDIFHLNILLSYNIYSNLFLILFCRLADLGLETFTLGDLFTRIFIPTSFLLVCILHLHYFHDHFLQLTDLKAVTSKQDNTIYRYKNRNTGCCLCHLIALNF